MSESESTKIYYSFTLANRASPRVDDTDRRASQLSYTDRAVSFDVYCSFYIHNIITITVDTMFIHNITLFTYNTNHACEANM